MNEDFTNNVQLVLKYSKEEAIRFGHSYVGSEHLLLGIIKNKNGNAIKLLEDIGCNINDMQQMIEDLLRPSVTSSMSLGHLPLTRRAERIIKNSYIESKKTKHKKADDIHLLLSISKEDGGVASDIFKTLEIDYELLSKMLFSDNIKRKDSNAKNETDTPTLEMFSRNISEMAENNELDPVIGRESEIERVAQILSRRKKNNPVLIGEPGVGKTAIIEGLAIRIKEKTVPRILWKQSVLSLDLAALIAGTKYRGQFEERMRSLMLELEKSSNNIIFIDELHTLVGAGSASGSLDAANMFKPALARGEIQIIGATTLDEYRKHIEKDGALERRFQKIMINSPSKDDTVKILQGLQNKYEKHHKVRYSEAAIKACVNLSDRYITDKFLPDKAIDVLDEVGSRVRIHNINVPDKIIKLERKVSQITKQKETSIKNQNFEEAALLRDKEKKILTKINKHQSNWKNDTDSNYPIITEDEVSNVISMITGIPLTKVAESESKRLLNMPNSLKTKIIGQDNAIESLSKAILRSRSGFDNPKRPIGSFIFLGPTGIGKTELAKTLSNYLFTDEEALIKIDMSEYMERYNVSRLIGAPPGYVGHEEGGQLTEKVRRFPYSVVLFDEIEKAHKDVFNILLQILDEGTVTDSLGRKIDFKNTILILTSNIGTSTVASSSYGFNNHKIDETIEKDKMILDEVKKYFNPEFLNRLDEIITFNSLTINNLYNIIDLLLIDLKQNLKNKNVSLLVSKTAKEFIIRNIDHREWGARPIRRAIQNLIENVIAEKFVKGEFVENGRISIKAKNNSLIFNQFFITKKEANTAK